MIIGLVGKPSSGKSTFFKASTLAEVDIANYPFTTIEKNEGVGFVRVECAEKEFDVKCNPRFGYCIDGTRFVPVQIIDVAGLVPGAHEGKGRGNQFLDDLRQADVLIHVVDISGSINEKGEPCDKGTYDPSNDVKFLEFELDMWYLRILKKGWEKFSKQIKQEKQEVHRALAKQLSGLKVDEDMVKDAIIALSLPKDQVDNWTEEQLKNLSSELRRRTKPIIIAANKADIDIAKEIYERVNQEFSDYIIIPCSADSELALKEAHKHKMIDYVPGEDNFTIPEDIKLTEPQKKALEFIRTNVLEKFGSTGVQEVLDRAVFELLAYMPIFPGGANKLQDSEGRTLPDCFLLPPQSTAIDFANHIHSDLAEGFIKAIDVKTKQIVGKDHPLKPRDVIEIKSSK